MNILKKLFGYSEYYLIQERVGNKWSDIDTSDKYIDIRAGVATYAPDQQRSLRMLKVSSFRGKELKIPEWTNISMDDADRDIKKKKHDDGDFLDTLTKMRAAGFLKKDSEMDTFQLIKELREAEDRGRTAMMDFYEAMGGYDAEASKYKFYGGMSTDVKEGIIEAARIWKGDESDDESDQKKLTDGKDKPDEFDPNSDNKKVEVPELVNIILKYADANASADSLLAFVSIAHPKQYENIVATPKDRLVAIIAQYVEVTEPLKVWIDGMYETIEELKKTNEVKP